jgi:3-hydroxyisobutyrate dehydrogenase-like beta-hydroxyacid dehydrogenase
LNAIEEPTVAKANTICLAFIGFGELGQRFCRDLSRQKNVVLTAYDVVFSNEPTRRALAAKWGVAAATSVGAACADAQIIVSAVTADQVEAVAETAAGFLRPGQLFLDLNSASPATKKRAAAIVEASGADYVEGAVMAAVYGPGIAVSILAGGLAAERAVACLNPLGMNLTTVAQEPGRASAIKLCRSIIIKGLETLMVDCATASKHWGVEDAVYGSLAQTYPSIDWAALADEMGERVATHGVRRAAEMREAADMVRELGRDPQLALAVAEAQARGAKKPDR